MFSRTTRVSTAATRRRDSFSDARRLSTPSRRTGDEERCAILNIDACRERAGVAGAVLWPCGRSPSEETHGDASSRDELCRQVQHEDEAAVEGELSGGRNTRKKCTTGPTVKMRVKIFDGSTPQRVHGLLEEAQMRKTFGAPNGSVRGSAYICLCHTLVTLPRSNLITVTKSDHCRPPIHSGDHTLISTRLFPFE